MLKSAIRDNDPVCVMENTILYNMQGEVPDEEDFLIPLGKANVVKEGTDLSIIAHGKSVHTSLQVAQTLEEKNNVSVEVVDLRSIRPLDVETILASVRKTNRVLLVEENKPFCGIDAQISFIIQDQAFDYLDAPIKRVSAIDAPQAYSKALEVVQIPDHDRVLAKAMELI